MVAVLYDIHGNHLALEAVLQEVRTEGVDRVLVGGDVFPGPHGLAVLEALDALPVPVDFISGNGDADVAAVHAGSMPKRVPTPVRPLLEWVAAGIDSPVAERIRSWPRTRTLSVGGLGPVLFCHATPDSDSPIFTEDTSEEALIPVFGSVEQRTVFCGHTHLPFQRTVRETRVVNPGSVGLPFDAPEAAWAILGDGVQLRRTPYPVNEARALAVQTGYPGDFPMEPPGREAMLERYAPVEIGRRPG